MRLNDVSRILTIIGLVVELIVFLTAIGFGLFMVVQNDFFLSLIREQNLPSTQEDFLLIVMNGLGYLLIGVGLLIFIVFIINLFLFTKLISHRFDQNKMRKVLIYQSVWGGINLLFNQVSGVLYLISGLNGLNEMNKDKESIREGL